MVVHRRFTPDSDHDAALEAMSRFAIDPRWLVYLPPTMSPSETSRREGHLEHAAEAFEYFRAQGVTQVVCEEKHMGSRAVVVLCRDGQAAAARFGVSDGTFGTCFTRTGRRFFVSAELERAFLERLRGACDAAGLWERPQTSWVVLDCELMPWSLKAMDLVRDQYAVVGAAGTVALAETERALAAAAARGIDVAALAARVGGHRRAVDRYVDAYRRYCWPVRSLDEVKLAPFHLLASEGKVHVDQTHLWHLEQLATLVPHAKGLVQATAFQSVTLADEAQVAQGIAWWETLTAKGGEGMVVKPLDYLSRGKKGLVQPAIKSRGREYLRIIYGPDYTAPHHLERLRQRTLGAKRSLAHPELALGIEALERFVRQEPLRRVHECVFGVLALESEPVDPRL